ncbi:thioredoxin reductase [Anaerosolibacter carboniphilus]|uniref:Thioredoxin reductase n=1 Tax=Anaerosolibacter carboniphilus TaxID=1417629 RepID=A0A841KXQ9_9FIRM|nr:thioredoxin reductase [Anaerosolibacter carboniphilus]
MNSVPIAVIGAGPAGLSAAIEAAKAGAKVLVIDENLKPGGQLFKQIHKFFGSRVHKAGVRGIDIGRQLLEETKTLGIEVWLDTEVCGIDQDRNIWAIRNKDRSINIHAERIIVASGAIENAVKFSGWTLPGVMGAGAAQTMINTHRVLPGKKVLMVGSGNVGVIVSYQLMQAGAEVVGIIEAAPKLGGYGVHTAKVRRAGVPFYTSHTITRAIGDQRVEAAEITALDAEWKPIPGTEQVLEVDTICLATGLTPLAELVWIAGCKFAYISELGGHVPIHDYQMESSVKGIYIAGDISGVEEASTAMEEGRLAGISAAADLGYYTHEEKERRTSEVWHHLDALRCGQFGQKRKDAKDRILAIGKERIS